MSDTYGFDDRQTCINSIVEIRRKWSSTKTTDEEWDAIEKGLGLMYLYCPEDMKSTVMAHLQEADKRRPARGYLAEERLGINKQVSQSG